MLRAKVMFLVAYFSFSGNTQSVAKMISDELEADLFRIVVETPYTNDDVFNRAQDELNSKAYPALSSHIDIEVFNSHDTIILGFPIWWYDLPMPVWSFIKEYDFTGKTVIPFFTHNGSSSGANSLTTLRELLQNANVNSNNVLSIRGSNASNSLSDVKVWLEKIGLKH